MEKKNMGKRVSSYSTFRVAMNGSLWWTQIFVAIITSFCTAIVYVRYGHHILNIQGKYKYLHIVYTWKVLPILSPGPPYAHILTQHAPRRRCISGTGTSGYINHCGPEMYCFRVRDALICTYCTFAIWCQAYENYIYLYEMYSII